MGVITTIAGYTLADTVEHCPLHGEFHAKAVLSPTGEKLGKPKCPQCLETGRPEAAKADPPQDWENRIRSRVIGTGVPERFSEVIFDDFTVDTPEQKKALDICYSFAHGFREARRSGKSLLMFGSPGTGKTMLCAAIVRHLVSIEKVQPVYTTFMKLCREVKDTYRKSARKTEQEALNDFIRADLLIIEEIGIAYGTEAEKAIVFEVIDGRYQRRLPTIITSNLSLKDAEEYIGTRVIDRLRDGGGVLIPFQWESKRGKA